MPRTRHEDSWRYPIALVHGPTCSMSYPLQFSGWGWRRRPGTLRADLPHTVALYLMMCAHEGRPPARPMAPSGLDPTALSGAGLDFEVVHVAPAEVSAIGVAIEQAAWEEGVTPAELARRLGVSRSMTTRLMSPYYFGHTSRTLRRIAQALHREVHVALKPPRRAAIPEAATERRVTGARGRRG